MQNSLAQVARLRSISLAYFHSLRYACCGDDNDTQMFSAVLRWGGRLRRTRGGGRGCRRRRRGRRKKTPPKACYLPSFPPPVGMYACTNNGHTHVHYPFSVRETYFAKSAARKLLLVFMYIRNSSTGQEERIAASSNWRRCSTYCTR